MIKGCGRNAPQALPVVTGVPLARPAKIGPHRALPVKIGVRPVPLTMKKKCRHNSGTHGLPAKMKGLQEDNLSFALAEEVADLLKDMVAFVIMTEGRGKSPIHAPLV